MKRVASNWLFLAAAASALLAGAGCADSESMMFIRQAQARVPSGTGCSVDNSPSSLFITEGTLDLAFRSEYTAALLVGNQLVARGNSSQLRTETSRIEIEGAVVKLEGSQGPVWGPFTVPGSGFIDPATGTSPAFGLTEAILVGSAFGRSLLDEGVLRRDRAVRRYTSVVKVIGKTLGGTAVESGEWRFPLSVCYGCLVAFPPEASDPKLSGRNCELPAGTGTTVSAPCVLGQDDAVDCRICKLSVRPQDIGFCQPL